MLSASKRRKIAARAAKDLKRKSVNWVEGQWLHDEETGEAWDPGKGDGTLGGARRWWRENGFSTFNKECNVCLEGALMVSLIQDAEIPDGARARDLLNEFQDDILGVDGEELGLPFNPGEAGDIVNLNDGMIAYTDDTCDYPRADPEDLAIKILEAAGRDPNPGQLTIEGEAS